MSKSIWRSLWLSLLLVLPSACGGGSLAGAKSPEKDELGPDLEAKAAELEAELGRLEGKAALTKSGDDTNKADQAGEGGEEKKAEPAEPSAEPEASSAPPASPAPPTEEVRETSPRERCRTACRALGSMQRSAERICSLVGEGHEKCTWARGQVKDARGRVEQAGCVCEK